MEDKWYEKVIEIFKNADLKNVEFQIYSIRGLIYGDKPEWYKYPVDYFIISPEFWISEKGVSNDEIKIKFVFGRDNKIPDEFKELVFRKYYETCRIKVGDIEFHSKIISSLPEEDYKDMKGFQFEVMMNDGWVNDVLSKEESYIDRR